MIFYFGIYILHLYFIFNNISKFQKRKIVVKSLKITTFFHSQIYYKSFKILCNTHYFLFNGCY